MRRGLWVRLFLILAVVFGLQVASLALTCAEHWVLPTAQHHHHYPSASVPTSHPHSDGTPHNHAECSLQGTPAVMLLLVPCFDCFCGGPSSIALLGVLSGERLTTVDDFFHERTLLKTFPKPPIFSIIVTGD